MDSSSSSTFLTSLNQKRKQTKHKKKTTTMNKPIKVRYISNPMRVETCASKFRELVQELTGQDAVDLPLDQPYYTFDVEADSSHKEEEEITPPKALDEEEIREYYSPLDEEMFASHRWFYNVNALGSIGSL